jgi:general secretion pathway protein G
VSLARLRKQGGFTLLELLIIIVIIGILGLLIIPNIIDAPKKNRDTQRKTDLRGIQKGLEEYLVANNSYPSQAVAAPVNTALVETLSKEPNPIIKPLPSDPRNARTTPYTYLSDGKSYKLEACLEIANDTGTNVVAKTSYTYATCKTAAFQLVNTN